MQLALRWQIAKQLSGLLNLKSYCIPRRHKLFGQTTKQTLNNSEPQKL